MNPEDEHQRLIEAAKRNVEAQAALRSSVKVLVVVGGACVFIFGFFARGWFCG